MLVRAVLLVFAVGGAFALGWSARGPTTVQPTRLADALPIWRTTGACLQPDENEAAILELAVRSLEIAADFSPLSIGAQRTLGNGLYRRSGTTTSPICKPPSLLERTSEALTAKRGLSARLVEYQIKLAAKLPRPSRYVIEQIARSAFSPLLQESDIFPGEDIRPLSRTALAGFGRAASDWAEIGYEQMSGNDSLGTGAAQVAVAAGHPLALSRVERTMRELLSSVPEGQVVPRSIKLRLYELGYALGLAGREAAPHVGPLQDLMRRKVQSWAPPFGTIELSPKRACWLLALVNVDQAAAFAPFSYCSDPGIPNDQ